jgi:hypothetical protein
VLSRNPGLTSGGLGVLGMVTVSLAIEVRAKIFIPQRLLEFIALPSMSLLDAAHLRNLQIALSLRSGCWAKGGTDETLSAVAFE